MARRNSRGALWALAAASGLWAWRNRDTLQSWISQQTGSGNNNLDSSMLNEGARQRDDQAPRDATEVQRDPFGSGI